MQLLIILALLLYGGKSPQMLEEVKPVLESFGGDEIKEVLKNAEEISSVLSAVGELTSGGLSSGGNAAQSAFHNTAQSPSSGQNPAIAFPLKPVSGIADRDIAYSLSRYISEN